MAHKVIQWATGFVGHFALRAVIEHPDLELVGVWVHSPDKVGKDAGDLCGLGRTGIQATNDIDALLALDADCVCSAASGDEREAATVDLMCRMLESGKNIVSTSVVGLVYPPSFPDQRLVQKLEAACRTSGKSVFTSGIEPGFASDTLPLVISGLCQYWTSIRVMEILDYATYCPASKAVAQQILYDRMGFGMPMDYVPNLFKPGVLTYVWGGPVHAIAAGLGVTLDAIQEVYERRPAPDDFEIQAGPIRKGTAAALRFAVQGIIAGRPAIVLEHITRLRPDLAPDWPQGSNGPGYYVMIEGDPKMTCHFDQQNATGDHVAGGILATATRVVNAIPAVCQAPPGLLTALDLPLVTGRHLMR
jgi:4-hydroxy-tetrahydrodipicolinate reductase